MGKDVFEFMRRWLGFALVVMPLLTKCAREVTSLEARWISHPVGGYDVTTVMATFEAKLTGGDEPIIVNIEWWWDDCGYPAQVIWSDQWEFRGEDWEDVTTFYTVEPGLILFGEYWVRIHWENSDGKPCSGTSNHCICSASDSDHNGLEIPKQIQ